MSVNRVADLPTWLLSRANARAKGILVGTFADFGLRPAHYRTLAALAEHGPLSQADLGRHLDLDRKDVTVALDALTERNLVRRSPDPTDGRRNVVSLTASGKRILPRLDRALDGVQRKVLAPLSAEERKLLRELLAKLGPTDPTTVS